jgi:2-methylcitrate dehydratase PrpD
VALALAAGGNGLKEYWDGYKNADVHAGARRVELRAEPAYGLSGRQARIDIVMKDGRAVSLSSVEPTGEPSNPLSADDLEAKFLAMTTMVVDRAHAKRIGDLAMSLERLPQAGVVPQAAIVRGGPSLRAA